MQPNLHTGIFWQIGEHARVNKGAVGLRRWWNSGSAPIVGV
jgi:hypothetical protein